MADVLKFPMAGDVLTDPVLVFAAASELAGEHHYAWTPELIARLRALAHRLAAEERAAEPTPGTTPRVVRDAHGLFYRAVGGEVQRAYPRTDDPMQPAGWGGTGITAGTLNTVRDDARRALFADLIAGAPHV